MTAANPLARVVVFGATSAMAQETARALATRGAELFLVGRDRAKVEAIAADLRLRGARRVESAVADLDEPSRHADLLDEATRALGQIGAVLVAQGILADSAACEANPRVAERVLVTNFLAAALLCQAAALHLAAAGGGVLVGISSVAGDRGRASNYAYGAAKGGLSVFLEGLRFRMASRNVHVVTVKPGWIDTPMTAGMRKGALFAPPSAVARSILRAVERRRSVVYVPGFWRVIMLVIRHLPAAVLRRLPI